MTIETVRRVMTRRVMMVLLVLVVGGLGVYGAFMHARRDCLQCKSKPLNSPPHPLRARHSRGSLIGSMMSRAANVEAADNYAPEPQGCYAAAQDCQMPKLDS